MAETDPPPPPPPLTESARSVYDAARGLAGAWGGTFSSLRRLLAADFALAREALVRGLLMLFLATIMFGTMWVLLTAFTVWLLFKLGLGAGVALGVPLLVCASIGAFAMLHARKASRLADMDASRRQVTLWFGSKDEVAEASSAPPGSLDAGAAAPASPPTSAAQSDKSE